MTTEKLEAIRELFSRELASAVLAGQHHQTIKRLARLVLDCDERLERNRVAVVEADEPTVERRQRIYDEATTGKNPANY